MTRGRDFGFRRERREIKRRKKRTEEVKDEVKEAEVVEVEVEEAKVVVDKVVVEAEELTEMTTSGQSPQQLRSQKLCKSDKSQEGQSSEDENTKIR